MNKEEADFWRPLVAAAAEVAWLKEAERIEQEAITAPKDDPRWAKHAAVASCIAEDYAGQWRKWGEQ